MNKAYQTRSKILCCAFGAAVFMLGFKASFGNETETDKPNLVVVFTDDQVHNAIGYDNPEVHTPHLDALAAEGVIFERAFVASPICAASRASVMTGLFPQQHGVIALNQKQFESQ